ncbi:hypothetical protein [Mesobacterium pallidum]|nr:hypothetical protein [Mesobacterium pallidum]
MDIESPRSAPAARFIPIAVVALAIAVMAAAPWWAGRADLRLLMEVRA